ncbi:hypothetical protein GT347_06460 [Xylophilus rhododendri]|uniref:Lipoprotein n=1 Tax=Xylophilus rhododendri TaxID=2697032 RepID=A0A857J3M2_9BURK|nr:hypothetical protein [Xylophilus rhododendri]QHI97662.1 hypothetical protein GT347_06460 [Xylophilus rhododendri]
MSKRQILKSALLLCAAATLATGAMAETPFQQTHPRRAEVNARLAHQNQRIHNEVAKGEISRPQAAALHAEDRQVRTEERAMASQNGGHITRAEKQALNQQENGISRQIGK